LVAEIELISENVPDGHKRMLAAVDAVWRCESVTEVCASLCNGIENPDWAFRAERALKVAKWLFIEQDITDWNTSGRAMLMNGIEEALSETGA
jgi:hypothetical protein